MDKYFRTPQSEILYTEWLISFQDYFAVRQTVEPKLIHIYITT
jgi:hypothetical protein